MYIRAELHGKSAYVPQYHGLSAFMTDLMDSETREFIYTGTMIPHEVRIKLKVLLKRDIRYQYLRPKQIKKRALKFIQNIDYIPNMRDVIDNAIEYAQSKL